MNSLLFKGSRKPFHDNPKDQCSNFKVMFAVTTIVKSTKALGWPHPPHLCLELKTLVVLLISIIEEVIKQFKEKKNSFYWGYLKIESPSTFGHVIGGSKDLTRHGMCMVTEDPILSH